MEEETAELRLESDDDMHRTPLVDLHIMSLPTFTLVVVVVVVVVRLHAEVPGHRARSSKLATIDDQSAYLQPAFTYHSNSISPASSLDPALGLVPPHPIPAASQKRKTAPGPAGVKPVKKVKRVGPRTDAKVDAANAEGKEGDGKPKRVRTGCLTCRERHLKCDEGLPDCNNCRKSNRHCKRGVRLNFIDTWVGRPPHILTLWGTEHWRVEFMDESREIASEYRGGSQRYRPLELDMDFPMPLDPNMTFDFAQAAPPAPELMHQALPSIQGMMPDHYPEAPPPQEMGNPYEPHKQNSRHLHMAVPHHRGSAHATPYANAAESIATRRNSVISYHTAQSDLNPDDARREVLDNAEETLFMQVFIEEVGSWMDSMDSLKHFSRLLPFHSLSEPMLLNAFLACGARHLTLINPAYTEEKALHYYDTATRFLLKNLQNPNRDTVICATTAVILNVYEIMSERALQRMNHIAGARALIKECGWNARAQGIGSACFWLNVGLEVLSCLHFNWQVAWDPEEWGVDMDFSREIRNGQEEVWTHRMLYIIAKICNFRATIPRPQEHHSQTQQQQTQQRFEQWTQLKAMVDGWNAGIPRTMQPMAYVHPFATTSKSLFPEVWLVKRTTTVARLFFHTAQLLMAQIHPYFAADHLEMMEQQRHHSQMICGIAAHVKDRGVASVCLRSLAHAAEVLTDRNEQAEVLAIFDKIHGETGWRIGFVYKELKQKWGWNEEPSPHQFSQTHTAAQRQMSYDIANRSGGLDAAAATPATQSHSQSQSQHVSPPMKRPPAGIPNPMYAKADFSLNKIGMGPYQSHWVAPAVHHASLQQGDANEYTAVGLNSNVTAGGGVGSLLFNNF